MSFFERKVVVGKVIEDKKFGVNLLNWEVIIINFKRD